MNARCLFLLLGVSAALAAPALQYDEGATSTEAYSPDNTVPELEDEALSPQWEDDTLSAEEMLQTPDDAAFEAMAMSDPAAHTQGEEDLQVDPSKNVPMPPVPCSVACKPEKDHGGGSCVQRSISNFFTLGYRGTYCSCKTGFAGIPCDLGPSKCGEPACFDKGLKTAADKSLLLSAVQLSALVYYPGQSPKEKAEREAYCPGIDKRMGLKYKHYTANSIAGIVQHVGDAVGFKGQGKDTRLEWGIAHGSFGQRGGKNLYAIAFRGTVSLANWITNFKALASTPNFLKTGYVHWGFLAALRPHINDMVDEILKAAKGHDRLLVAGHSLGGALANIFALIVKTKFEEAGRDVKVQLITLGAPRVGTSEFQHKLEDSMELIHRIVGKCDAVPKTPTHAMTTKILAGLPFAERRLAVMVHAGPQVTVGCDTWWCTHHHLTDHLTSTYLSRVQSQLKGEDNSLCPQANAKE